MRTLSIIISLSLVGATVIAAPPGRDKPKHEQGRETDPAKAREQAAREQTARIEANRVQAAYDWAGTNIVASRIANVSVKLQMAMRTAPHTVEVVNSASKVRSSYKPLSVSDLVTKIIENAKSPNLSAEKKALATEAVVFATFFKKIYTGGDAQLLRAQDAAFRQLETLADMTEPGFAEKKPNEIKSTMDFLVVANKAADGKTIAEVYLDGIKATRGEDPAIIKEEIEDIANCQKG